MAEEQENSNRTAKTHLNGPDGHLEKQADLSYAENGRNNPQYCWANNVRSCCVRVGIDCKRRKQLSKIVRPAVHH